MTTGPTNSIAELERPATALLSYAREDAEEIKYLELQLKVRGVRTWRDIPNLPIGSETEDEIVHAIENMADAFVLYVTPHLLQSDFVWNIEIPAALKRRERDPGFNIVSVLKGVSYQQLQQQCATYGYRNLAGFDATQLPTSSTSEAEKELKEKLRSIADRVLKATLTLRLRRAKADRTYEPSIVLRTFKDIPPVSTLDLDLNWWDLFQGRDRLPPSEEWQTIVFPALQDVKNALGELSVSRNLHISLQAILPTAIALGYFFPVPARYTLLLEREDGTWSTSGEVDTVSPLQCFHYDNDGDEQVAVVEIAIAQPISRDVTNYLSASHLSYHRHISFQLPDGADHIKGVKDGSHALAMAQQIGRELRILRSKGVKHIHLFVNIPAALAVMLGHQFNALCPISLYQFVDNREYQLACVLGLSMSTR